LLIFLGEIQVSTEGLHVEPGKLIRCFTFWKAVNAEDATFWTCSSCPYNQDVRVTDIGRWALH
jgi:hypothetical protein